MTPYSLQRGVSPLLVSVPHAGTELPEDMKARLTAAAAPLPDTDWHVEKLYDFAPNLDATLLVAKMSRYVIDLNRSPDGAALYPGADETGLCPTSTFDRQPIYRSGSEMTVSEAGDRIERYWRPYHEALKFELDRIIDLHGFAVLWDAHSIRSRVPRFFEGRLPDLNFGTADGASADAALAGGLMELAGASDQTSVLNGRFKGGYITRAYGAPAKGVQAVQLELSQRNYMNEAPPYSYDEARAADLRGLLEKFLILTRDFAVGEV